MVFCGACGRLDGVCGACGRLDGVLWSLWQAHVVESCLVPELGPLPAAPALKSNSFLGNSTQLGKRKKKFIANIHRNWSQEQEGIQNISSPSLFRWPVNILLVNSLNW